MKTHRERNDRPLKSAFNDQLQHMQNPFTPSQRNRKAFNFTCERSKWPRNDDGDSNNQRGVVDESRLSKRGVVDESRLSKKHFKKEVKREFRKNENILCAIIALMGELDKKGLEFV